MRAEDGVRRTAFLEYLEVVPADAVAAEIDQPQRLETFGSAERLRGAGENHRDRSKYRYASRQNLFRPARLHQFEGRDRVNGPAVEQAAKANARAVEEARRVEHDHAVGAAEPEHVGRLHDVVEHATMVLIGAFRVPGRAGGVGDPGDVIGARSHGSRR